MTTRPPGPSRRYGGNGDGGGSWWQCPWRGAEPWLLVGDTHTLPQFPHSPYGGTGWAPRECLGSEDGKSQVKTRLSSAPKILAEAFPTHSAPWKNKTIFGVKSGWFQPFYLRDEERKMDFLL